MEGKVKPVSALSQNKAKPKNSLHCHEHSLNHRQDKKKKKWAKRETQNLINSNHPNASIEDIFGVFFCLFFFYIFLFPSFSKYCRLICIFTAHQQHKILIRRFLCLEKYLSKMLALTTWSSRVEMSKFGQKGNSDKSN